MHAIIAANRKQLIELCRRFGVTRLEVFGSAARASDFDPGRSDIDFLVEFAANSTDPRAFLDFSDALETLLGRPIDLVMRSAVEKSQNYIRRRAILRDAEAIYG